MPHPMRPGPFQDGGELAWIVWAIFSLFSPTEKPVPEATALPVMTLATNSTVPVAVPDPTTSPVITLVTNSTVPVAFRPRNSTNSTLFPTWPPRNSTNSTLIPTSLPCVPCVPVTSPFAAFWDIFQSILAYAIVTWLIPFVVGYVVDVLFAFLERARTPSPPPSVSDRDRLLQAQNELRNRLDAAETQLTDTTGELQRSKIGLERADRDLADVRQQLRGQQSFGEEQRSRAEERGKALAASDERAQELREANAKLSDTTKSASDNARAARMRLREHVARHNTMATALAKERQRSEQLVRAATTHQDQAGKWRQKAEGAETQIAELQSRIDVAEMQPSEAPDTFRPSNLLKDQLAEAIAARDSTGEKLVAAEEQAKQLQQSQADLQGQLDKSVAAKVETETKVDALETDKHTAEAAARSLQERVQELEKSASLGDKARADVGAELTSSQEKLAAAESTVTSLQGQLGEAGAVKATSDSRLALAEEEKSKLVVAKEKAERQQAAVSRELDLAAAARKTELEGLEREKEAELQRAAEEKEAALQQAAEEKRALEEGKESTDAELKAARQELAEAKEKIAELVAWKQQQEAIAEQTAALFFGGEPTGGNDNVGGQGEGDSYDPFGPNDGPLPFNNDDALFDPAALNNEPLPPDFQFDLEGLGNDAPAGGPQAPGEFNFAEPPAGPDLPDDTELGRILAEWHAAHPEGVAGANLPPTEPASDGVQQQVQQQQAGPNFPSSSFSFTPPSTVPTSTVPQQAVQGGPSLPPFSFSFTPPSTVPTSTVAQQQGQPPQGGPIFGGFNFNSAPSNTPFSADLSFFSTDAHPSTVFTGQAPPQVPPQGAGASQDYNREITDADWAEGWAEFQDSLQGAKPPGDAEHDPGGESSTESEEL